MKKGVLETRGPRHKKKIAEATLPVLLFEAVNELVPVIIRGQERRIPKKQAIVLGLVNDALAGTPNQRLKAFKALVDVARSMPPSMQPHDARDD